MHKPVMLGEVIRYLEPVPGDIIVDCTIGEAGHAAEILSAIRPSGKLIGIDQDKEALDRAECRLKDFDGLYTLVRDNFQNLDLILDRLNIDKVDGALFDLGVASFQFDEPCRGFSFQHEAPLDMRMDRRTAISAFDLVNHLAHEEMVKVLRSFGQERWANRIARRIVKARKFGPITTTTQLAGLIVACVPPRNRHRRIHPATRTFQAFRIAVNRELEALEVGLSKAIGLLAPGARICAISFHSLEDRIVKNQIRCSAKVGLLEVITKRPITPKEDEIKANPRCRSAKLRVAKRVQDEVI